MSHSICWYIENEVIYTRFTGKTSPDEISESMKELKRYIDSSPRALVHVINDSSQIEEGVAPKESLDAMHKQGLPEGLGWTIIISTKQSSFIKMGAAIATSLFKVRTRFFDSLEEGIAFLKEVDTNINWEQADQSIFDD